MPAWLCRTMSRRGDGGQGQITRFGPAVIGAPGMTETTRSAILPTMLRFLALLIVLATSASASDWQPIENIETYEVAGQTGLELYRSIGANGPEAGGGRAIAWTDFRLTWTRDYRPSGGGCTLAVARPKLTIVYRLPKLSGDVPDATRVLWNTFVAGVDAHERVHGQIIVDMVTRIEAFSVGLRAENDPKCQKIRKVLTARLSELSQEQRRRSKDFDRQELSEGGTVHRLVLSLINGE